MLFTVVVDTSASMAVRTALGLSCLGARPTAAGPAECADVAKALVERLVQQRQRLQCRDRFLLLCTGAQCVRSSWLDSHEHFAEALKNLHVRARSLSPRDTRRLSITRISRPYCARRSTS